MSDLHAGLEDLLPGGGSGRLGAARAEACLPGTGLAVATDDSHPARPEPATMTRVETVRLTVPCPTCHVPQPLVAAYRSEPANGGSRAVLTECTRCWTARARALNEARAGLRCAGALAGGGRAMTWRGELLSSNHEHDGLECAMLSALLRRDIRAEAHAELALPAAMPREAPAKAGSGG